MTVLPSLCIAASTLAFVALSRNRLLGVYAPKISSPHNGNTNADVVEKRFSWMTKFYQVRDIDLLTGQDLDPYLLLRYLRLCMWLCFSGCVTLCPILLSVDATGAGGMNQLDRLTIANVRGESVRLYAHSCCTIAYFALVMYMVAREKLFYIELRHMYLTSRAQTRRPESRTVLFTDVPKRWRSIREVKAAFGDTSDLQVWLVTRTDSLRRDLKRRTAVLDKLDTIVTKYPDQLQDTMSEVAETLGDLLEVSSSDSPAPAKSTATKKSRIEAARHYASEFVRLRIDEVQGRHKCMSRGDLLTAERDLPTLLPCIFVRFGTVEEAQIAYLSQHCDELSKATPRCMNATTKEIIWKNLGLSWRSALARRLLSQILILAMIVFWSFPVAFVTAMTNIDIMFPNLRWREIIPSLIRRALEGLLPSILLSLLMSLPPKIIAMLGRFAGFATVGEVENYVQGYYFWFRIIQVFLVAALGSTASSILMQIYANPSSSTTILAKRLPGASNFYFSYLVVQGLNESAFVLLNVYGLFLKCVLTRFLDDTPRKRLRRQKGCFEISIATVSATCSSLLVIALCYAPAAPLMLCFAALAFTMFYLAYRYNLHFTAIPVANTGGKLYVRALQHTMVGVYIGELFLIGLLTISAVDGRKVKGPLILAGALLACTVLYQKLTHEAFKPWGASLPVRELQNMVRLQGPSEQEEKNLHPSRRSQSRLIRLILDDRDLVLSKLGERGDTFTGANDSEEYYAPELTEQEMPIVLNRLDFKH